MPKKRGKRRDKNGKKKGVAALRELEGDIAKLLVDCLPQLGATEAEAHSSCLLDELTDLPPQSWPTDVATWVELLEDSAICVSGQASPPKEFTKHPSSNICGGRSAARLTGTSYALRFRLQATTLGNVNSLVEQQLLAV